MATIIWTTQTRARVTSGTPTSPPTKTAIAQLNSSTGSTMHAQQDEEDDALGHRRRGQADKHGLRDQPVGHHARGT